MKLLINILKQNKIIFQNFYNKKIVHYHINKIEFQIYYQILKKFRINKYNRNYQISKNFKQQKKFNN